MHKQLHAVSIFKIWLARVIAGIMGHVSVSYNDLATELWLPETIVITLFLKTYSSMQVMQGKEHFRYFYYQ